MTVDEGDVDVDAECSVLVLALCFGSKISYGSVLVSFRIFVLPLEWLTFLFFFPRFRLSMFVDISLLERHTTSHCLLYPYLDTKLGVAFSLETDCLSLLATFSVLLL